MAAEKENEFEAWKQLNKFLEKEGKKGWNLAQETMLKEKPSSQTLEAAMRHIMFKSPPDYFRPALLSLCSKAVGGSSEITIPAGASLVLIARAIGIHDDIIDQSKTKGKHTTVLGQFGRDIALILSDILLFKAFTLLRKTLDLVIPTERVVAVLKTIEKIWFEQSEGEILEISSRGKTNITFEKCLAKIEKRASEMEAITRIGAILGRGSRSEIEALGRYGRLLGMAAILRDELIDMLDFKALRHRIKKESSPAPLVYALQNRQARSKLVYLMSGKRLKTDSLREISRISDHARGMEIVAALIEKLVNEAYSYVNMLGNKNTLKQFEILIKMLPIHPEDWRPILQKN